MIKDYENPGSKKQLDQEDKQKIEQTNIHVPSLYHSLTRMDGPLLSLCPPPPYRPSSSSQPSPSAPPPTRLTEPAPLGPNHDIPGATLSVSTPLRPPHQVPVMVSDVTTTEASRVPLPHSTNSFSLIASRTRQVFQAPMIQVMGTEGPALVFRPWSMDEMRTAMRGLLDLQHDGENISLALNDFCREVMPAWPELKCLLTLHLGPTDFSKIRNCFLPTDPAHQQPATTTTKSLWSLAGEAPNHRGPPSQGRGRPTHNNCFICGSSDHWAGDCPRTQDSQHHRPGPQHLS